MLIKDKDILSNKVNEKVLETAPTKSKIDKKNMRSAWGDAFDYYIRGFLILFRSSILASTQVSVWTTLMGFSSNDSLVF